MGGDEWRSQLSHDIATGILSLSRELSCLAKQQGKLNSSRCEGHLFGELLAINISGADDGSFLYL